MGTKPYSGNKIAQPGSSWHLDNILKCMKHRIINALPETTNAQIEKIKRIPCGYRNRRHYRTAIYFNFGGLNLYPKIRLQHVGSPIVNPEATSFKTSVFSKLRIHIL